MEHDRLFKQLLTTFFVDFLELFLPEVAGYLDRGHLEFMDKEILTDLTAGDRHEVDLLVKTRFRGSETCFLVHVENQATAQEEFPKRMFRYFARLHEKFDLPVYPIALFSYDAPQRAEPDRYQIAFPDKPVMDFSYRVIQLNRLNWRDFVRRPNPVAAALMAKMRVPAEDRPRVALEFLRIIATLRLDPARSTLLSEFIRAYLRLTPNEREVYNAELERLDPAEKGVIVTLLNPWEVDAFERGLQRKAGQNVLRLLAHRFGEVPQELRDSVVTLPEPVLDELVVAVLDFQSLSDASAWVDARRGSGS